MLIFSLDRVYEYALGRHGYLGMTFNESLRVMLILSSQRLLSHLCYPFVFSGKNLSRRKPAKAAVVMGEVIPVDILLTPLSAMGDISEFPRVVWLIFCRFKLALTERIIVADAWAAMACSNTKFAHQVKVAMRYHR